MARNERSADWRETRRAAARRHGPAPLTDAQLDAILGHCFGVRGPTLEEAAEMLADDFRLRADYVNEAWTRLGAAQLRTAASILRALAELSREGDDA
jgi:hypothetical protein